MIYQTVIDPSSIRAGLSWFLSLLKTYITMKVIVYRKFRMYFVIHLIYSFFLTFVGLKKLVNSWTEIFQIKFIQVNAYCMDQANVKIQNVCRYSYFLGREISLNYMCNFSKNKNLRIFYESLNANVVIINVLFYRSFLK